MLLYCVHLYFFLLKIPIEPKKLERDVFKTPKIINGKARNILKEKLCIVKDGENIVGRWMPVDNVYIGR